VVVVLFTAGWQVVRPGPPAGPNADRATPALGAGRLECLPDLWRAGATNPGPVSGSQ